MEKFCLFEVHEYMDMYPHKEVRTFKGESETEIQCKAFNFAKEMTENYSGGPTHFVKIMTREEAADFMASEFKKCLMDTCWPDAENIKATLKFISENNIRLFFECYGRNSNK